MSLEYWQDRLHYHFQALAAQRKETRLPTFALEHNLRSEDVKEINDLLRQYLKDQKPLDKYWLLWVVYATEIGYRYEGDEYWQSFEEQTQGWDLHHHPMLSKWFNKFQKTFQGFKPTGRWAKQFSRIAWPITHAILPEYLQEQFAKELYQQRYHLADVERATLNAVTVGRILSEHVHNDSERFRQFLQQKELTGRIALGLLSQTPENGHEPIYATTLKRILDDFNRVHKKRGWLRRARAVVIDRFQGIGQGTGPSPKSVRAPRSESEQPDLSVPSIFLRHSGAGKWAVAMEVPSFRPVIDKLGGDLEQFLKRTRCRLAGATDFKPGGWTLSGNRTGILKSWPDQEEPLLAFEAPHERLDPLLQEECRISPGPNWLFRLGADGRGRQITGLNVHPGVPYILVSVEELSASSDALVTPCTVECSGVQAVRICMPEHLSDENRSLLKKFGLEVARTVRVWPAGLPCRNWDGEGQSEWLVTDKPQFGLMPDHSVASYSVCLDGGKEMQFEAPAAEEPAFIQLDPLPVGMHHLVIMAQRTAAPESGKEPLTGYVDLKVRVPRPWKPGRPEHAGFAVIQEPFDADLDQLWANEISLAISGPDSRKVTCKLSLENSRGEKILSEQICSPRKLPVQPDAWRRLFRQFLNKLKKGKKGKKGGYWDYLAASSGILRIQAEELGEYVLRFHRNIMPVRWVAHRHHGQIKLRLVDEAGLEGEATCEFYSMNHPTKSEPLKSSEALAGFSPEPPGGLFTVRHGEHRDAIIISVLATDEGLGALRRESRFKDIEDRKTLIPSALHILTRWHEARAIGDIANDRKTRIVRETHNAIYKKLCGSKWADAEVNLLERKDSFHIKTLQKQIGQNVRFAAELEKACAERQKGGDILIQWYAGLARRHGVSKDRKICEFAARLAFEPHELPRKYADRPNDFWHRALSNTEALRGARYASLRLSMTGNKRDETQTGKP